MKCRQMGWPLNVEVVKNMLPPQIPDKLGQYMSSSPTIDALSKLFRSLQTYKQINGTKCDLCLGCQYAFDKIKGILVNAPVSECPCIGLPPRYWGIHSGY